MHTPGRLLALSVGAFGLTILAVLGNGAAHAGIGFSIAVALAGFGVSAVLALWGTLLGVSELWRGRVPARGKYAVLWSFVFTIVNLGMLGLGVLTALMASIGFSRGRQLRRRGRVLLPPVSEGGAWASTGFVLLGDAARLAPVGLAQQWRENGRTEHASVASFARLTLDLMALGAPPALVAAANRDALDEIRHTEACFSLASALDGKSESPGAFPEAQSAHTLPRTRTLALATLAVTSLVDGALHEGVSARIIAKLARRCENPTIAGVLRQIAADEGRHAAHGWDVVEWCLAEGGVPVAQALLGALRVLPAHMRSDLPEAAASGAWERWGIHSRALEAEEYAEARAHVVRRVRALVVGLAELGATNAA